MYFQTAVFTRKLVSNLLDELNLEQLNYIPAGFTNNIFWNIAHLVVTEQMLTYGLSGLNINIEEDFILRFKKGSTCLTNYTNKDVETLKNKYLKLINNTKIDFKNNRFKKFTKYPTSTNIQLNTIEDALQFNSFHEGIHLGVILSIKKQLK